MEALVQLEHKSDDYLQAYDKGFGMGERSSK
jgi:hypothetical protein